MVTADLCREIAVEAVRRGARANVHELWALLEHLDGAQPDLIVDVGSGPAGWWAWWSLCPNVIGVTAQPMAVQPAFSGPVLPSSVTALHGELASLGTVRRVVDQAARRPVDVLVMSPVTEVDARYLWTAYAPIVREGGQVLVHGIASPQVPGVGAFWNGLASDDRQELIGATDPDGYGIVTVPRKVSHG